jgi:hypothetical protein
MLHRRSNGVMMRSSQTSADASGPRPPLQASVEILANLIYHAWCAEAHSERDRYLDWTAEVIEEVQHDPKLRD